LSFSSGKTGAFALPILQSLLETPQKLFALVLTPTRELAFQIAQQFEALGAGIGLMVAVIVGGVDMTTQALALAKRPHIIVATPGRLVDHLENTKGFSLRALKYLVMDEADRILNMDFEVELDKILRVIPKERRTYLFSATMTKKVAKLERASLKDPARVEVSTKYKTVDKLKQHYLFIPFKYKVSKERLRSRYVPSSIFQEAYLVYLLNELAGNTAIVFCATCNSAMQTAMLLRQLGMQAVPLHGQMGQEKRLGALNKFKSKVKDILVCTDVASRGLDIPHVDLVVNYDVPSQSKDYIHRVGRTARAGRAGLAVTFVTQYDVEVYQKIEAHIGKKLTEYPCVEKDVMLLVERTQEASEMAVKELKEMADKKKKGKKRYVMLLLVLFIFRCDSIYSVLLMKSSSVSWKILMILKKCQRNSKSH
ncbi:DEAD/DEAH box helicase, partial [Ancylostoma ceylanicum]